MRNASWLLLVPLLIQPPVWSCGGRGCGKVNVSHGKLLQRSDADLARCSAKSIAETAAIEKWSKFGSKLESDKRWSDAEQSYHYVLGLVSLRDGPGSFASVPALERLVKVSKAQNKLDQAISYQQTALLLRKAQPNADKEKVLNAQLSLGELLVKKENYFDGESVLKETVAMYKAEPSLPQAKRDETTQLYAKVLRKLHLDSKADAVELAAATNNAKASFEKSAESKPMILSQKVDGK